MQQLVLTTVGSACVISTTVTGVAVDDASAMSPACRSRREALCPASRRRTGEPCSICAGHHQHDLKQSGCTQADIDDYCAA
eukprot:SAG11_NODE_26569_length_343_cov_1.069672_1_plen_80_part_01